MMEAVKQDFSSTAANILITFGLEHSNRRHIDNG